MADLDVRLPHEAKLLERGKLKERMGRVMETIAERLQLAGEFRGVFMDVAFAQDTPISGSIQVTAEADAQLGDLVKEERGL